MPLRADGSPVWAFRSPGLRIAAPARLPEIFVSVAFVGRRLPAHSCATAPVSHRIPLVPCRNLSSSSESHRRRRGAGSRDASLQASQSRIGLSPMRGRGRLPGNRATPPA